jgi:hypothetical protein
MKWLYHILIIVLFASCSGRSKELNESQTSLKIEVFPRGSYKMSSDDTNHYYLVEARLINTSDSIVKFLIMSCSNYDNFVIDSKEFKIKPNDCYKNSTYLIPLSPKQIFSTPLLLYSIRKPENNENLIKIGFVLIYPTINPDKLLPELLNEYKIKGEKIIWSQPFNIYSGAAPFRID